MKDSRKVKTQLIEELQTQRARTAALEWELATGHVVRRLEGVATAMRDRADIEGTLAAVGEGLRELGVPFDDCGVNVVEGPPERPEAWRHSPMAGEPWQRLESGSPNAVRLARFREGGEPVYRPDLEVDDPYREAQDIRGHVPVRSVLDVPFSHGTLTVNSVNPHAFAEAHIEALVKMGAALSRAMGRRDALTAQEQAVLALRREVWQMREAGHLHEVLRVLRTELLEMCPAVEAVSVQLVDEVSLDDTSYHISEGGEVHEVYSGSIVGSAVEECWREQRPVYRRDLVAEDRFNETHQLRNPRLGYHAGVRSVLDVPFSRGTVAVNSSRPDAFGPEDVGFLRRVGDVLTEGAQRLEDFRDLEQRAASLASANRRLTEEVEYRRRAEEKLADEVEERSLAQERSRFQAELLANAREAITATDEEGRLIYWGSGAQTLFGYTPEEALGKPLSLTVDPASEGEPGRWLAAALEDGAWSGECQRRRRDGSEVWTHTAASRMVDTDGHTKGFTIIDLDVTDRHREAARSRSVERVRECVWQMTTESDLTDVLDGIAQSLRESGVAFTDCGINLVDTGGPETIVRLYDAAAGEWTRAGTGRGADVIADIWRRGEVAYRRDLERRDPRGEYDQIQRDLGHRARSVVDVPFSQGTLAASHTDPDAFGDEDIRLLRDLARALDEGLRRVRDLELLRESQERYRRIAEAVTDYVYTVTVRDGTPVSTTHGEACAVVTGYTGADFGANSFLWIDMVVEEDREAVRQQVAQILSGSDPLPLEHRIQHRDGRVRWVRSVLVPERDSDGHLVSYDGIVGDITDRREAENELLTERGQLLSIFDSIDEVIYVSDPDTYEILYVNQAVRDAFGRDPVGGTCYREFQGFDSPCEFCTNEIIRKQNPAAHRWEYHNPVLGRDYAIVDRIIRWPDNREVRFELAVDITDRKRAEAALVRSSRLSALGQMAAGMAHELNQPLMVISTLAEGLELRLERGVEITPARQMEWSRDTLAAVRRMRNVIEHLRVFSRDDRSTPSGLVSLGEVIEGSLTMVGAQLRSRGIDVQADVERDVPPVLGDRFRLEQVVVNLVTNARDALEARRDSAGSDWEMSLRIRARRIGGEAVVEVADNGVGLSPEAQSRLFQPFYTTKGPDQGTGLGLSISHGIVADHGGVLECDSREGEGAVFTVRLPAAKAPAEPA